MAIETKNIYYCDSKNRYQTMDFYRPKNANDKSTPVVMYIHGGGWNSGSKTNDFIRTYGPLFIQEGVSLVAVDYRLVPKVRFPDQNNDIGCALNYISNHAGEMNVNIKKALYVGESAGAELALFAALNPLYGQYPHQPPVGVVDFYGVSDFSQVVGNSHPDFNARNYLGKNYSEKASVASPINYVNTKSPAFLIFHGSADSVVPINQSKSFYDKLISVGVDAHLVTINGVRHGFTGYKLTNDNFANIKSNLKLFIKKMLF